MGARPARARQKNRNIAGILLECTELPPYADALRAATGLAVWDAITGADFYINAYKEPPQRRPVQGKKGSHVRRCAGWPRRCGPREVGP